MINQGILEKSLVNQGILEKSLVNQGILEKSLVNNENLLRKTKNLTKLENSAQFFWLNGEKWKFPG